MAKTTDHSGSDDQESLIARKLAEFLEGAFESVQLTRRQHFEQHENKRPNIGDVSKIISSYANQNALIAGAANLVPGPLGALTIFPEITLIIRNQIQMIYDLGVAYGKEAHLSSQTLLAIFSTALGGSTISIATVRGGQFLVKRTSLRVLQQIIKWLGGKITQRVLRGLVARWVPIVGAAAMAVWARQSTIAMGRKAAELLRKEIVMEPDEET